MYAVSKTQSEGAGESIGQVTHHPVFGNFPCWQGTVPQGFFVNFLGVMTRVDYFDSYAEIEQRYPADRSVQMTYPDFDEEYFEWIDVLEAVLSAKGSFTMLELGAGYGRWTANAAAALKQRNPLPYTLIAVEAEPVHFRWMTQHLADNSVDPSSTHLIQAAVAAVDGKVGFRMSQSERGGPSQWYGQHIGGSDLVDAVSLDTLLQQLGVVDLIDLDVQGAEHGVLEAASERLDRQVKRVHIGTHGPQIEDDLRSLFNRLGWECIHSFPLGSNAATQWGTIAFQDGVQTWANPTFSASSNSREGVLAQKLDASRREGARLWQELEKIRQERQKAVLLEPSSAAWKMILAAGRMRDWLAPSGSRRRRIIDFLAKKV